MTIRKNDMAKRVIEKVERAECGPGAAARSPSWILLSVKTLDRFKRAVWLSFSLF